MCKSIAERRLHTLSVSWKGREMEEEKEEQSEDRKSGGGGRGGRLVVVEEEMEGGQVGQGRAGQGRGVRAP